MRKQTSKTTPAITPRMLRPDQAAAYVGGETMLELFRKATWAKPAVEEHRLTVWDRDALDKACDTLTRRGFEVLRQEAEGKPSS